MDMEGIYTVGGLWVNTKVNEQMSPPVNNDIQNGNGPNPEPEAQISAGPMLMALQKHLAEKEEAEKRVGILELPLSLKLTRNNNLQKIKAKLPKCAFEPAFPKDAEVGIGGCGYLIGDKASLDFYLGTGGVAYSHPPVVEINTKAQTYLTFAKGRTKFPFRKEDMEVMDLPPTWPLNFFCPFCQTYDHCIIIDNTYSCPRLANALTQMLNQPLQLEQNKIKEKSHEFLKEMF